MGKEQSKCWGEGKPKQKLAVSKIKPDGPLGQLLQQWGENWLSPYTRNLEKKMVYYCESQWPQNPLIDPEYPYNWSKEGETSKYWMDKLRDYLVEHKLKDQLPYLEVWYHVRFEGPDPDPPVPVLVSTQEDSEEDVLSTPHPPPPPPPPLPPPPPAYPGLRPELAQLQQDVQNFPFPQPLAAPSFPVREVANGIGGQGVPQTAFVAVPIKPSELRELKKDMPKLHENAHEVAEKLELFLGPSEYTYPELMYILGHLFTPEERNLIRREAMAAWDRRQVGRAQAVAALVKFPVGDPNWDLNNAAHREHMRDLKNMILEGIKLAIPQGKNPTKAFEVTQGRDESPGDFCARLRESLTKHSGVEPDTPAFETLLKVQFVTKAWPDIQKKIQKMNGWTGLGMADLMKSAQQVFVNRDSVKTKQKSQIMVAAVQTAVKNEVKKEREERPTEQRARGRYQYRGQGPRAHAHWRQEGQRPRVREVANGVDGQGVPQTAFVAVPIKPSELRELKRDMPKLHENAREVAEKLELFLGPSEYNYPELMYILGHLFTLEERNLIRREAMAAWDRTQVGRAQAVAALVKFPVGDPNWNLNDAAHREHMRDLKNMILEGIKLAIPQGKNLTKAFEVTQGKEESPGDFCARLRESLTKYWSGTRNPCL
ncbi:hypothetical protein E2320_022538 [Naja naja]|nr:hypothetical protein E2320_022538 [Naja naja]